MATSIFREYFKGYEILGELGRGNARVLKARSLQTGELVAIKHFAFNTDPDTLRRFQRESEIMKSIQHDYVVKIIEVHLDAELPYIVMQLIEGGDLRSLLKNYGSLDINTVIRLAHHMTEALDAIHAKAVVHRDVKPENIMYRRLPNGEIHFLLTDFGIAKLREQSDTITVTGSSMLTYDYASPEQFNQSKTVSTPTDYYSLGVVLYECLTGAVPFEYEQDDLLMHINRVIASPIPVPHLPGDKHLPPSFLQLLEGLMTKQGLYRLADPVKVRHLLRMATIEDLRGIEALPPAADKHTMAYQSQYPTPRKKKHDITFITLLLLVISVVVFFSWTTLVKSDDNTTAPITKQDTKATPATPVKYSLPVSIKHRPVMHNTYNPVSMTDPADEPATDPGIDLVNGMYFNDFSDPQDSSWDVGRDDNSEFYVIEGKYIMKGMADSLSYSSSVKLNLDTDKDFSLAANVTHLGGNGDDPYGVNFCGNNKQDCYLIFYITANGFYSIGTLVKDQWRVLVDWTASSHIRPDGEVNTLSVEKKDGTLSFLINDKVEKILPFTGGFGNHFGMRVDGAQTVSYDQFIVKGAQ
jgi:serine/threonine protein kinase